MEDMNTPSPITGFVAKTTSTAVAMNPSDVYIYPFKPVLFPDQLVSGSDGAPFRFRFTPSFALFACKMDNPTLTKQQISFNFGSSCETANYFCYFRRYYATDSQ